MENTTDDLAFLSYLLDEEIYLIDSDTSAVVNIAPTVEEKVIVSVKETVAIEKLEETKEVIVAQTIEVKEEIVVKEVKVEEVKIEKPAEPVMPAEPPVKIQKAFKKIVVLVGYPAAMPAGVADALLKIFSALQITMLDIEIINVLDPQAKKVDDFTFSYLILMGGSGKNIEHLKDFAGTRNRYDIAVHKGAKIYFAEAMDVYMKPENIELKKKFWAKLKEVFGQ